VIRQKNGADTLYTLHTSRSSGDLLLTNEELPRVASRRREVRIPVQKPFRLGVKPRKMSAARAETGVLCIHAPPP
jgi:hypothetical protein